MFVSDCILWIGWCLE